MGKKRINYKEQQKIKCYHSVSIHLRYVHLYQVHILCEEILAHHSVLLPSDILVCTNLIPFGLSLELLKSYVKLSKIPDLTIMTETM